MYFVLERPKRGAVKPVPQTMNERMFYRKPPPGAKRKLDMVSTNTQVAGTSTDTAGQSAEDAKTDEKEAKKQKAIDVAGTYRRLF